jgi:energy-coupling factor transport system permease protein
MDFLSYGDDAKALLHLDPRPKLLLLFSGGVIAVNCYQTGPMIGYTAVLCVIAALCGLRAFAVKAFALYAVVMFLRDEITASAVAAPDRAVIPLLGGLCALILFGFPMIVGFVLIIKTTRISQFLAAFQRMRLPTAVIIPVAVFFRFIPTVQEEWAGIRKAMAFRGISMSPAAVVRRPLETVERMLIPLLFSTISVMDELSAAALARGLDGDKRRTYHQDVRLRWPDHGVMALVAAMIAYVFATK